MSTVTASRPRSPSLGPAVIVVALAVLILVAGAAVAMIGTSSAHPSVSQLGTNVPGVPFKAIPAASDLTHIAAGNEPPPDIVKALTVPAISHYVGYSDEDGDAGQFDRSVTFSAPATAALVAHFYSKELPGGEWSMQFNGTANGQLELIGQRSGSDGYQWRVAIVITTVNPTFSPSLAGSNQTSTSSVVMTLYQVEDAS